MPSWCPRPSHVVALAAVVSLMLGAVVPLSAQDHSAVLGLLRDSRDFRVRVQAAFALGNTRDASVRPALERALSDQNPAVRAAAATSLGRLGSPRSMSALQRARRDSSAAVRRAAEGAIRELEERPRSPQATATTKSSPGVTPPMARSLYPSIRVNPNPGEVPWNRVRYIVILGDFTDQSSFGEGQLRQRLRDEVLHQAQLLQRVRVFDSTIRIDGALDRQIRRHRVPKVRLDGTISKIEPRTGRTEVSVRCEVSVMMLDENRAMRGMMSGAATGSEPRRGPRRTQVSRLAAQALEGAVRGAFANADTAILRVARR